MLTYNWQDLTGEGTVCRRMILRCSSAHLEYRLITTFSGQYKQNKVMYYYIREIYKESIYEVMFSYSVYVSVVQLAMIFFTNLVSGRRAVWTIYISPCLAVS
jgi:hypothetical protein